MLTPDNRHAQWTDLRHGLGGSRSLQGRTQYVPFYFLSGLGLDFDIFLVILGATNPLASAPGTIRGDYAIDVGRNVCHGSDGVESAKKEIDLWFKKDEIQSYESSQKEWIYEKP